jgi:mannitol-1-phosphate 5-dehydrogenase
MKKAVHFGAGNIGRGFLGQLYSQSGWRTVFVDVDQTLVAALNSRHAYQIDILGPRLYKIDVPNVSAVDGRDLEAVAREIADADLLGTSVGVNVLPKVAPALAKGLEARVALGRHPIDVLVCENLLDAANILRQHVLALCSENTRKYVESKVGFVGTVVSRMVPIVPDEARRQNPLYMAVEEYAILPVDKRAFVAPIPEIKGMEPVENLHALEERKLFTHNCGHALCAYWGYREKLEFLWQVVSRPDLKAWVLEGLWESGEAQIKKHGFTRAQHEAHINNLLERFANRQLGDTVFRVARDPIRKLGRRDRLVGAALLAMEYWIAPRRLVEGITLALRYDEPKDEKAVELQSLIRQNGFEHVLENICGLKSSEPLRAMVLEQLARQRLKVRS